MITELPRGYELRDNCRIRKKLTGGGDWSIYLTSNDSYALIISPIQHDKWLTYLENDIFIQLSDSPLFAYISSNSDYLISSFADGPYPDRSNQIVAFSSAFGIFAKKFPGHYLSDAIYIEELSLILPLGDSGSIDDMLTAYGRWLTGGVSIPGNDIDRLSGFMSWLPKKTLIKCTEAAGIAVQTHIQTSKGETDEKENVPAGEKKPFELTGRPELERFFRDHILDVIENEEAYNRMGISFPGATILFGPPGCGKTFAVDQLSEYLGWPRFDIEAGTVASPYIHDTSKKIAEVFAEAIKCAPSILVIDEMEAFLTNRSISSSGNHHVEEVAEFLRRIPEAIEKHVLIFAMTNMIDSIDPAILRRGRFDHIIEVKMASAEEISELLTKSFAKLPIAKDVKTNEIAERLSGHPLSDVSYLLKEAGRVAVKEHKDSIDYECFEKAYGSLPKPEKKENRRIGF